MATLNFASSSSQYVGFTTLSGGLESLTSGPHTIVALGRQVSSGTWRQMLTVANSARTRSYASLGFRDSNTMVYDTTRSTADDGTAWADTTNWIMAAVTVDTADTPDAIFHRRNHTTDAAWTHINGNTSPGYDPGPSATGRMQIGRWLTSDYWNGQIALIAAWTRKLSNTELDEIIVNDRTSDLWGVSGGPPAFLVECNVAYASLIDLAGNSVLDTPVSAPTLTGSDPDRWTFDAEGGAPPREGTFEEKGRAYMPTRSGTPAAESGKIYFDTNNSKFWGHNGTTWRTQ